MPRGCPHESKSKFPYRESNSLIHSPILPSASVGKSKILIGISSQVQISHTSPIKSDRPNLTKSKSPESKSKSTKVQTPSIMSCQPTSNSPSSCAWIWMVCRYPRTKRRNAIQRQGQRRECLDIQQLFKKECYLRPRRLSHSVTIAEVIEGGITSRCLKIILTLK
jgi:hypothetical protein